MAQGKKGRLNYRCPQCFNRDIDIDLFYDEDKKEYYCLRCCFHGDEKKVLAWNQDIKLKYGHVVDRLTDLGADNEPATYHPYQKGEL